MFWKLRQNKIKVKVLFSQHLSHKISLYCGFFFSISALMSETTSPTGSISI